MQFLSFVSTYKGALILLLSPILLSPLLFLGSQVNLMNKTLIPPIFNDYTIYYDCLACERYVLHAVDGVLLGERCGANGSDCPHSIICIPHSTYITQFRSLPGLSASKSL